jgi:hypothetical protein
MFSKHMTPAIFFGRLTGAYAAMGMLGIGFVWTNAGAFAANHVAAPIAGMFVVTGSVALFCAILEGQFRD